MQGSTQHFWLGLKILTMLVAEFNQPTPGRTLTVHRKVAVAFRDPALFKVFELALLANQQLQADSGAERRLREQVRSSGYGVTRSHTQLLGLSWGNGRLR